MTQSLTALVENYKHPGRKPKPVTGMEIEVWRGNSLCTRASKKYLRIVSCLKALGFPETEATMINKMDSDEIAWRAEKMYYEKAWQYHPDRYKGSDEIFKQINAAYTRLKELLPKHHVNHYQDAWAYRQR